MLWHMVQFTFHDDVPEEERRAAEDGARSLADSVPTVRFLRLGRSMDEPRRTGLLVGFDDADGLAVYNDHPAHTPVAEAIDGLCADVQRLDMLTPDDPSAFAPGA